MIPSTKSAARYHPLINAKQAEHDTVNKAVVQAMQISEEVQQDFTVMIANLQIYKVTLSFFMILHYLLE